MVRLKIKPLSVNEAWQGRRYKTKSYQSFETHVLYSLPPLKLPEKPFKISFVFGFSNVASDIDNPIKMLLDVLQKKYGFNDKDVYELVVKKEIVKKSNEFFEFKIECINQTD